MNLKDISSCFCRPLRALSFYRIFFQNFLLKTLYIPPRLRKFFKYKVLRLLDNAFASQKIESRHFYWCIPSKNFAQVLVINHLLRPGNYSLFPSRVLSKIYSPSESGQTMESHYLCTIEKGGLGSWSPFNRYLKVIDHMLKVLIDVVVYCLDLSILSGF